MLLLIESIKFANMTKRMKRVRQFVVGFFAIFLIQMLASCANIVPPSGGPRDSIPPYLVVAKPKDSTVNIQPQEITAVFNEYISATTLQENLIVSPSLKNNPLIDVRLNTLRIRIKDSLAPNTTYSIQFGNAIRDVNEGNIAANFTYTFSTGATLDTGRLFGTVRLAETGRVDTTLLVVLHPINDDSAIFKNKPLYYTKINRSGNFQFRFLPAKPFQLFVVPNDYSKKYDDSTKMFAFLNESVQAGITRDSLKLYAFEAFKKVEKKKTNTTAAVKGQKNIATKITLNASLDGTEQDLLNPLYLNFENPIHLNDSFPLLLCDTNYQPFESAIISLDSTTKKRIIIDYPWEENTPFRLIIPQKALKDSLGNTWAKTDTLPFTTKAETAYGTCLIRFSGQQQYTNPILLLTKEDKILFSYPMKQNLLNIPLIPPGEYVIKILEDLNNNGQWDTGRYGYLKWQPETIQLLKKPISIRANRENEFNLIINK